MSNELRCRDDIDLRMAVRSSIRKQGIFPGERSGIREAGPGLIGNTLLVAIFFVVLLIALVFVAGLFLDFVGAWNGYITDENGTFRVIAD